MIEPAELRLDGDVLERADAPGGDGRTIVVRMVRWDTPARTPEGYLEAFTRGAFGTVDPARVTIESSRHGGSLVGRGLALEDRDDGGYLTARIARTAAGDELLTLVDEGVLTAASVVAAPLPGRTRQVGDVVYRDGVDLWRVAIVERGVHAGAGVVAVRAAVVGGQVMEQNTDQAAAMPTPQVDADAAIARALAPVMAQLEAQDTRLAQLVTAAAVPAGGRQPYVGEDAGSLGDLLLRAWDGEGGGDLIMRALVDQVLIPDNAALARPAWITEAVGIVNGGRPAIAAFGGARSLPASGMRIEWPELVPLAGRAIAVQAAEKTEVVSRKISFTSKGADLATYAGASDISIQLLRRSSPSYRELYARVMLAEYARVTEDAFVDAVLAGATGSVDYDIATDTDGALFAGALFAASVKVQRATGSPASVALVAEDVFVAMGGWLKPVNPQNGVGTGNARGLNLSISGVDVVLGSEDMPPGTILVSNGQAAAWYEDGPNTIEQDDVAKLGRNVGYYGIAGTAIPNPAALIELSNLTPLAAASKRSSSSTAS